MHSLRYLKASFRACNSRTALAWEPPPVFLCPAIRGFSSSSVQQLVRPTPCACKALDHDVSRTASPTLEPTQFGAGPAVTAAPTAQARPSRVETQARELGLPSQCTGCGAFTQFSHPDRAGYFSPVRTDVQRRLGLAEPPAPRRVRPEDEVVDEVRGKVDVQRLKELGIDVDSLFARPHAAEHQPPPPPAKTPLCDRCHNLMHHSKAEPIAHPSIDALRETIEETPYKYNHIYHVVDAADFPMSLLPRIRELLDLMPLRSRNRRAQHGRFFRDRKMEMSFVITRSDLLAPKKEMVDRMMPVLVETLRDALGRTARNVRLGNVRCVSSKRSWWTKELKKDIWDRGGAGWMVGKVNVGKSQLFEAVFPKGMMNNNNSNNNNNSAAGQKPIQIKSARSKQDDLGSINDMVEQAKVELEGGASALGGDAAHEVEDSLDELALLPPVRSETNYPEMPIVSSLPGTTASPIRVPFGNGRGELIDLPGLERTLLDRHVLPEHRHQLLMKRRMRPEQEVLRPGTSLLLGGFIRLTPRTPGLVFLAYSFTPMTAHVTRTDKALLIQGQTGEVQVENIAAPGTADKIRLAGSFPLRWDVTKVRAGPITRRDVANMRVDDLPYRVLSTDILIEGCGWVEVVAQVRTKDLYRRRRPRGPQVTVDDNGIVQSLDLSDGEEEVGSSSGGGGGDGDGENSGDEPNWPVIDVYSPEGKFIGARRPLNAWLLNKAKEPTKGRPKRSMVGDKKRKKAAARALQEKQNE